MSRRGPVAEGGAASGRSLIWLQGLLCGAVAAMATPVAVVLGILLAPGLAALALDRAPGKPAARAMLLFGMAATARPLLMLWRMGHSLGVALHLALSFPVLGLAWSAAGGGWLLSELIPLATALVLEAKTAADMRALRAVRARLEEDWGVPPADRK
ncbi:MAG TPA: hypothetical protein VMU82_06365 [Acetobacteraceae bacterium]|nr:hypothetical protein [Acetobacteraceae bacterium]